MSDNEDDVTQGSSPGRIRGASKEFLHQPLRSQITTIPPKAQDQSGEIVSSTAVTGIYANEAPSAAELAVGKATRRNISAQIPTISALGSERPKGSMDLDPASSPSTSTVSTPSSPITAIIDQDAEKFRIYMNKLNNPNRRNVSAPIQVTGNRQDLASVLGQAVAMENIQQQIEIQNQLMGQVQSM